KTTFALSLIMLTLFAVAIPSFIRARRTTAGWPRCVHNLMQIDSTKDLWMKDNGKTTNDLPTWEDLRPYFQDWFVKEWGTNGRPICPAGGTYILGRAGEPPRCSIGGPEHTSP